MSWLSSAFKKAKKSISISNIALGVQAYTGLPVKSLHNKVRDIKGEMAKKRKVSESIMRNDVYTTGVENIRTEKQLPEKSDSINFPLILLGIGAVIVLFKVAK